MKQRSTISKHPDSRLTKAHKPSPKRPPSRARASKVRKERAAGLIAAGKKRKQIAVELGVSETAVKRYKRDPEVQVMVEQRRQEAIAAANVELKEVLGTLARQMRGSILDVLTPRGGFTLARARASGCDGLIKTIRIREEVTKSGKRAQITRVEIHSQQAAAIELAKILGLEKQRAPNQADADRMKRLLDERVAFAIEGFRRGGVTLTRRDVLKMYASAPESAGEFLPWILAELAAEDGGENDRHQDVE